MSNYKPPSDVRGAVLWLDELVEYYGDTADRHATEQTRLLQDILDALRLISSDLNALRQTQQNNPQLVQSVQSVDKEEMDRITPVVIDGQTYTSPKLMQVIRWLEVNPTKRNMTVREIAEETGVSKSWVAIAKKYNPVH